MMMVETRLCRYGIMLYRTNDRYLGRSLKDYGEFSEGEVALFRKLIKPEHIVLDIGANIGAHTLPFSQMARRVLAFEPVRILFQMLNANMAVNDVRNVHTYEMAIGDAVRPINVPVLDYDAPDNNLGSTSLEGRGDSASSLFEQAPMCTLDSLRLRRVDFIKADVEGMEERILIGGKGTILRDRPLLYLECDDVKKYPSMLALIHALDYKALWHVPDLYNPGNFAKNAENVFPGISSLNILCLPEEYLLPESVDKQTLALAVPEFHPRAPSEGDTPDVHAAPSPEPGTPDPDRG